MKQSKFSEERIAYILRQAESGTSAVEVCRQNGISEQTFYRWKKKYGGMGVPELRRLRQLEDENSKLKQLVADLSLDKAMLQEVISKSSKASPQEGDCGLASDTYAISQRRACGLMGLVRASLVYQSRRPDDSALKLRMRDLAASRVSYGYRRIHVLLRREGWHLNHKRVYRLYTLEGLSLRLKTNKKRVSQPRVVQPVALTPNERWSLDFVSDTLGSGPRLKVLTAVDHFSRVSPAIEVDTSWPAKRVIEVLERAVERYGLPQMLCVDNGPEFTSRALDQWAHQRGVKLQFSRPGKPTDNAMIETFNAKVRAECLDQHWFTSLEEAKEQLEAWRQDYNEVRPHSSLNNQTPAEFLAHWQQQQSQEKAPDSPIE